MFGFGVALAAVGGVAAGPILSLYPGMDAEILIPAFIVIVIAMFVRGKSLPERGTIGGGRLPFAPSPRHVPTLAVLASEGNAAVLDLVLTNQERLLTTPGLIDKVSVNPALRGDQRGRLMDLIARFFRGEASRAAAAAGPGVEAAETIDAEQVAKLLEIDVGELFAASEIMDAEEFAQSENPVVRSAYKRILTLNTAQKAILAMKGGREERVILVRDTNKVVALSVLKNPRMTEGEVETIAAMRNVSDEILRNVGVNREWSKNYAVVANLVRNPRTPPSVSTNFVSRLNNKDLKTLGGDRNVPEIIRRMAKRTFELRTQKAAVSFRKK
jgi:hypothetical protein